MRKTLYTLVTLTITLWTVVIVPAVILFCECADSYVNGAYHGFNSDEFLIGFSAFVDTFMFYLCFFFPLFILWGCLVIAAISVTVALHCFRKKYKSY